MKLKSFLFDQTGCLRPESVLNIDLVAAEGMHWDKWAK